MEALHPLAVALSGSTDAALQPGTRTLHTSVSVTLASAATREITNTGIPAG